MIIPRFRSEDQNLVFIKIEITEVNWYIYIYIYIYIYHLYKIF